LNARRGCDKILACRSSVLHWFQEARVRLFLSYQRADSRHVAGRLRDRVVQELGPDSVFLDVDSISIGRDVREAIRESIAAVDVFVVLIGSNWDVDKLARANDYVHMEILEAVRQKKPIVPVLLDDRSMPSPEALPADIADIAYRNAGRLRADPDFGVDCARLIRDLETLAASSSDAKTPAAPAISAVDALLAAPAAAVAEAGVPGEIGSKPALVKALTTEHSRVITIRIDGEGHIIEYRTPSFGFKITVKLDGTIIFSKGSFPNNFNFTIGSRKHRARIETYHKDINKIGKMRLSIDGEVIYSDGY
jgi:TIR domain